MEEIIYETKQKTKEFYDEIEDTFGWAKLKQDGSEHYKSGGVEPIDLYKAGNMFHDFACASIIKYAFRSRKEIELGKEALLNNMNKIIHYAKLLMAYKKEK